MFRAMIVVVLCLTLFVSCGEKDDSELQTIAISQKNNVQLNGQISKLRFLYKLQGEDVFSEIIMAVNDVAFKVEHKIKIGTYEFALEVLDSENNILAFTKADSDICPNIIRDVRLGEVANVQFVTCANDGDPIPVDYTSNLEATFDVTGYQLSVDCLEVVDMKTKEPHSDFVSFEFRYAESGGKFTYRFYIKRKDGSYFYDDLLADPILNGTDTYEWVENTNLKFLVSYAATVISLTSEVYPVNLMANECTYHTDSTQVGLK